MPSNKYGESTPLLRSQQQAFPGSGAFPAPGTFPQFGQFAGGSSQYQSGTSQFHGGNPYQTFRYGGMTPRPQTPQPSSKAIHHSGDLGKDPHSQFCALTGCPPTNAPPEFKYKLNAKTLYGRAIEQVQAQNFTYQLAAAATNTLLLLQIVLGAALTGLGGAGVPSWVITVFGAANTIIAGLVAYLKSRGQPMRARMFRDEVERVVDEIENSEVMWLGISKGVHGYDDIDTEEEVTVRSEVARLTRLLDRAIRNNANNNPEMYSAGGSGDQGGGSSGLRGPANPFVNFSAMNIPAEANVMTGAVAEEDESPALKSKKKEEEKKTTDTQSTENKDEKKPEDSAPASNANTKTTETSTSQSSASGGGGSGSITKTVSNFTSNITGQEKGKNPMSAIGSVLGTGGSAASDDASPATSSTTKKTSSNTASGTVSKKEPGDEDD